MIDKLKPRLLLLKKSIEETQDESLALKEEADSKYVKSYSLDNDVVLVHPERFTIPSSVKAPEGYLSPPSSRQEELLKALDLTDPKVLDAICKKLQDASLKEFPEATEEEPQKNRAVAIDSSAVIYMSEEEEISGGNVKTPTQSKIPSRSGGEYITSAHDVQVLIKKLLTLKETLKDESE